MRLHRKLGLDKKLHKNFIGNFTSYGTFLSYCLKDQQNTIDVPRTARDLLVVKKLVKLKCQSWKHGLKNGCIKRLVREFVLIFDHFNLMKFFKFIFSCLQSL